GYGDGYILSTHLEAVQARRVFPCVDHPAYKAVFKVGVRTDADLSVISNMPIESETKQGSKKTVTVKKTPKMSTYLLYLSVGKSVAHVIAHEIAHMWFGDLVTMKWWDDLWLNESFATFMDFKSTDRAYPEWKVWQDFVRTSTSGAMGRDALTKTHPIMAKVHDPEEIEELFDEISYGKGASILRMIEAYIGSENFKKGVAQYLQKFRYSNASGHDLWSSLQEASG